MGRIADVIPALYHGGNNDLIRFVDALDVDIKGLEKQVRGITDLINVDKCPDDKLPYLAALTNCPLIGNDPVFWRRQLKNWPYILKLKGTQRSLELVLDSIGAASWDIKTFFRDAGGGYITTKPSGAPFLDADGLWHNIRTHYFGIEFTLSNEFVEKQDFYWDVDEVREKLNFWFERGKPYHAELLNMIILPPKFLPDDHICKWDWCDWEHVKLKVYDWGLLTPTNPIFDKAPLFASEFERRISTITETPRWGFNTWDNVPMRILPVGSDTFSGLFCFFEIADGQATWLIPSHWNNQLWDQAGRIPQILGSTLEHAFTVDWDEALQLVGQITSSGFSCDLRPYWDLSTWPEHFSWVEEVEQQPVLSCPERGFTGQLNWQNGYDNPLPTWSKYKTWAGSNTWRNTAETTGTWDTGTWNFQEAI